MPPRRPCRGVKVSSSHYLSVFWPLNLWQRSLPIQSRHLFWRNPLKAKGEKSASETRKICFRQFRQGKT